MSTIKRLNISIKMDPPPSLASIEPPSPPPPHPPIPIRLVTFNIRYAATSRFPHEQPWSVRVPLLIRHLQDIAAAAPPDAVVLFGLQEVLDAQLADIKAGLGPAWAHIGVGRDDGARAGEYNPVLFQPARARLLRQQTRWLSPTPEVPSFGWRAGSRRVITAGVFEHAITGRRFIAANTHLDNASAEARTEGVGVVLRTLRRLREEWGPLAVSLTGDLNSSPGEEAYGALEASGFVRELYVAAGPRRRFGPYETYTGFEEEDRHTRIDFAWIGPTREEEGEDEDEAKWAVERYEVVSNVRDGVHISDHRPVLGDLRLVA